MAINIPIITEFADAGLKSARGAFDNFKTKVAEAEAAWANSRLAQTQPWTASKPTPEYSQPQLA
jgi:hypothetical protein